MFKFNNKMLYIVLLLLFLSGIGSFVRNPNALLGLVLTLPGVLVAITFHEFAHAYAADKLGDDTPRMQGRLNLNPLSHLDPVGTFLLIFAHFGWGKPVQINPRNFNRNISMQKGEAIVSFAGPLMNFILSVILTIIAVALLKFNPDFILTKAGNIIYTIVQYAAIVNIGLGIFNLLPFPPLDGSKIFINILPYNARTWIINNQHIFYIIFLVIWITGIARLIISPLIDLLYTGILKLVAMLFGLAI